MNIQTARALIRHPDTFSAFPSLSPPISFIKSPLPGLLADSAPDCYANHYRALPYELEESHRAEEKSQEVRGGA